MTIDDFKGLMDAFDPASLFPDLDVLIDKIPLIARIAVLIGPVILLVMGLLYLFASPKEANYYFGYRCMFGMGSVEAWRFTQRRAGAVLGGLGLILTGVMLVISMGFPGMEAMDMVWKAFWCLIWQGVLALLANAGIWLAAFLRYDARGNLRKKQK